MAIRRFNIIVDTELTKKTNRDYVKAHRDEWSGLGFRSITYMVHDSERSFLLAELDVRRSDKLVEIAMDRKTDLDILESISRRNMAGITSAETVAKIKARAADSAAGNEVRRMVDIAAYMLKRQAALVLLFGKTADRDKRVKIAAKGVAYSAAASARYRLAQAILDYAPTRPMSVFGIEGAEATIIEENWEDES